MAVEVGVEEKLIFRTGKNQKNNNNNQQSMKIAGKVAIFNANLLAASD